MTTQHTPEFIAEMKTKLLAEEKTLNEELKTIAHRENGDFQANYPEYGRHPDENAEEIADFQARASTTETIEDRLQAVKAALQRISDGTYGMTPDGEKIPEERLRANPAATDKVT